MFADQEKEKKERKQNRVRARTVVETSGIWRPIKAVYLSLKAIFMPLRARARAKETHVRQVGRVTAPS